MTKNTTYPSLRHIVFIVVALQIAILLFSYCYLLNSGRAVAVYQTQKVNSLTQQYPILFEDVFLRIISDLNHCQNTFADCEETIKSKFDEFYSDKRNLNRFPMYFIRLSSDQTITKLFQSGKVIEEQINTREEKLVKEVLTGERELLYGPYFNQEVDDSLTPGVPINYSKRYFKPAYLKDLYSQVEVIVPYYHNGEIIGAVVWLHGE